MHAFLITKDINNNKIKLLNDLKVKKLDFTLQKIDDSRELKKITKYSFPEKTAIIIDNIDTSTIETQNSFLKNLEEPNLNLIYILTAKSLENVLPTIISRCQVINSSNNIDGNINLDNVIISNSKDSIENTKKAKDFLKLKIDEKFKIIEKIKDREEAINFVESLILVKHKNNDFDFLENYLLTLGNLNKNGNVSLQLTNLLITSFS